MDIAKLQAAGISPALLRLLAAKQGGGVMGLQPEASNAVAQESPQPQPGVIASLKDIPDPTPEEQETLLGKVGRKTLSGLQWVGESLDKPGRAIRGLLAGRPGELLDAIPFSDTLGLTTPEDDVSGRDLLETYGVLGKNTPGFDAGDVAGFAAEVLTDPLNMLTLGGGTIAKEVLKDGAKSAKALTAATKAQEIAAGVRPLVQLHTPAFGLPLPAKIPFTSIPIPRVELPVRKLGEFGKGEKAARIYEALHYGQFSPNPYVRKVFSAIPEVTASPIGQQKNADLLHEAKVHALDNAAMQGIDMLKQRSVAGNAIAGLADQAFKQDAAFSKAEALRDASKVSDQVKSMIDPKIDIDAILSDPLNADRGVLSKLAETYDKVATNQKSFGEAADIAKQKYEGLMNAVYEQASSGDPFHAQWFNDTVRQFVEKKDGYGLGDLIDKMKAAGFSDSLAGFDEAAQAVHETIDGIRRMYPELLSEGRRLGIEIPSLDDYFVNYAHRRATAKPGSALFNWLRSRMVKTKGAAFQEERDPWTKDWWPEGTKTLNEATRDPMFTATKHDPAAANAAWASRSQATPVEFYRAPQPGTYMEAVHDIARENDVPYPTLNLIADDILRSHREATGQARALKRDKLKIVDSIWGGGSTKGSLQETTLRMNKKLIDAEKELASLKAKQVPEELDTDLIEAIAEQEQLVESLRSSGKQRAQADPNSWRRTVNKIVKADGDYTQMADFDRIAEALGMQSDDAWEFLKSHAAPAAADLSREDLAKQALAQYRKIEADVGAGLDPGLNFDTDSFDTLKDPTAYPDAAYGGKAPKRTLANVAYALAEKYNLPVWWKADDLMRSSLAKSSDSVLSALSQSELGMNDWRKALQKEFQARGADWAHTADLELFMSDARLNVPELSAVPIMGHEDLMTITKKLAGLPKEVLQTGLYNRSATEDAVDYLLQWTKMKAGVSTMRSIMKAKGAVSFADDAAGVPLHEVWKKAGLTDEGLADWIKEVHGADLPDEEIAALMGKATLDPEIADTLGRYVEVFKDPQQINDIMQWVDAGNATFKGTLTIPYPAFHNRNRISGAIANWVAGIWTGDSQKKAQDLFLQRHIVPGGKSSIDPETAEQWLNELKSFGVIDMGGAGGALDPVSRLAGLGDNDLPVGLTGSNARDIAKSIFNPFGELIGDTKDAYREGGLKGAAKALLTGRRRADGSTAVDLNPFGMQGALDPLGLKKRAGDLDEFGKPLKGAAKFTSPETTNAVYQAGMNANKYVEWQNRVAPYIALREAGWSPALAARKVKQVQFDYREMSPIERKVFKRVIPFYSFMKLNLAQQVRLLAENPGGRNAQLIRAENTAAREGRGQGGYVPKYLAESFAVRLPGGDEKQSQYFSQSGLLPFEEAFNRFSFDDSGFPLNVKRTAEKFLAQAHPLIQGPAEQIAGRQFWSGRRLDDLYQSPTSDPDTNFWLSKSPLSRVSGTVGGAFDPRKSALQKVFNLAVGGAKITDVNTQKQRLLEVRDILEEDLAKDPAIAQFTGLYANDIKDLVDRYNAGDQEAARMLKLYLDLKKELKDLKAQEAAPASS